MSPTRTRGVWWTMATQKGGSLPGAPSQLYRAAPMAITDRAPRAVQPIEPFHLTPCTSRTEDGCQFGPGLGGNRHPSRRVLSLKPLVRASGTLAGLDIPRSSRQARLPALAD